MPNTVHIFFNGDDCMFAPRNDWEKFVGVDTLRLFAVCAESWRRAGWTVRRLVTTPTVRNPIPYLESGEVAKSFSWYPRPFWQWTAAAQAVAESDQSALHLFGTIDILNYDFRPDDCPDSMGRGPLVMNFQADHFSLGLVAANAAWLNHARQTLLAYDRGELPPLRRDYVSDETILREYAGYKIQAYTVQRFAGATFPEPLLHFSRSSLKPYIDQIPLS